MAKKVEGYIKLQIPAGKATPAPPVGPALGQHGVNICLLYTSAFLWRSGSSLYCGGIWRPAYIRLQCGGELSV